MSPHCQLHIAKSPTPFHPLEWLNTLQIAQNYFFTGWPMLKFIPFLLKFMPQKRRLFNFHLSINSKKGSIVFLKCGGKF
jgi:hypothetical protein